MPIHLKTVLALPKFASVGKATPGQTVNQGIEMNRKLVTIYSNILFNGLAWYTVILSPASTCTALDLADNSRQLFTTWERLTSLVGKFGGYRSTRCSPSRVSLGSAAHTVEVAPERAWVWSQTLPCTGMLLGGEQPRLGCRMCWLTGAFLEGWEGHGRPVPSRPVPSRPIPPVPGRAGSCLQAAGTAECLHESSHQAHRSVGACTGSNRWIYFSNQVVQVIPLRIPLLLVSFQGVYFFSLSCSLDFICTIFLTDSDMDARTSY